MALRFVVPGPFVGKARPRLGRAGNVYTPRSTTEYEEKIGWAARVAQPGLVPTSAYVGVKIWLVSPKRARHDIDNIAKAVLDGMNKVVYKDDRQVLRLEVSSMQIDIDGSPFLAVQVEHMEEMLTGAPLWAWDAMEGGPWTTAPSN